MHSSLRLGALLATADGLAIGTNHAKKPAVQSLLESAKHMLKNGATPAVIDFSEETLAEITGVVIPAIINESENDQRFIYALHGRFDEVRAALAAGNTEVFQRNAEETEFSNRHKECRDVEIHEKCEGKRNCEMDLYHLWTVWVGQEQELREIHDTISDHFCPPGTNGTLQTFRTQSIPWMESYMRQKAIVDAAELAYDVKRPDCLVTHRLLDDQSVVCNDLQSQLEGAACAHELAITSVLQTYYEDFAQAQAAYNCAVEEVMELERDRKREWVTLQVVNCLLERIREQNGVPCDSEDGVTEAVGVCEELHGLSVCDPVEGEPRICLDYPPLPPCVHACPSRHEVVGVCLPVIQPTPCNGDFIAQEYADLPPYPLAPFSEVNPGCNAYPECSSCSDLPVPQPITVDECPGYTVDGCSTDDSDVYQDGELPLTFVRNVDGVADVRCCSTDGSQCSSQDFEGGVDYNTPGGDVHTGCYFDVTYQEAMTVCHNAGMRICSAEEMDQCCGTGCWHNHHAIWVNMLDAGMSLDQRIAQAEDQID